LDNLRTISFHNSSIPDKSLFYIFEIPECVYEGDDAEKVMTEDSIHGLIMVDEDDNIIGHPGLIKLFVCERMSQYQPLKLSVDLLKQQVRYAIAPHLTSLSQNKMTGSCLDETLCTITLVDWKTTRTEFVNISTCTLPYISLGSWNSDGFMVKVKWHAKASPTEKPEGTAARLPLEKYLNLQEERRLNSKRNTELRDKYRGKNGITLADCLDEFSKEERLLESEKWYCSKCKEHKCATKKFDLWKLPEVLVIQLKRFSYERYLRAKIDDVVDFPVQNLNLAKWVVNPAEKQDCEYKLYAVSQHYGGLGGGHYTAMCQNMLDNKWYKFNDESVTVVPGGGEKAVDDAAYVLFYTKQKTSLKQSSSRGTNEMQNEKSGPRRQVLKQVKWVFLHFDCIYVLAFRDG
jgi:hypothetical protein